ncbi:hypothetical protein ACXZ66_09835 [Corynebacterium sp. S7]
MAEEVDVRTTDVNHYIKPGRKRAPFLRYIRINLPKTTRALIVLIFALLGVSAGYVAYLGHPVFDGIGLVLWGLVALCAIAVVFTAFTKLRTWDFLVLPAVAALIIWGVGFFQNAPFVWNGGGLYEAVAWNMLMFCGLAYLVIYWALNYGMLVAWPDDQNFND